VGDPGRTALVALAGLPGTGKTTLARALAPALDAALLDKDRVRAALFAPEDIEYSREQDDLCARALHAAAELIVRRGQRRWVVLDGRTYTRRQTVEELVDFAARLGAPLHWVECACADDEARRRLDRDAATGAHLAANRGIALYVRLKAEADPLVVPRLTLQTDAVPLLEQVRQVLDYVGVQPEA
jgi:predicted kinase